MIKPAHLTLLLPLLIGGATALRADDVALLEVKFPNQKATRPVAIEFYEGDAPATVENFKKLVHKGFYKGLAFHRAFPHVLVQIGDPYSSGRDRTKVGTGGPGYTLPAEIRRKHAKGAVAMARLPDKINPSRLSNGSQFYVCLAPMPSYDGQYTVFGHVLYGLDVLDDVSIRSVDSNDNPLEKVKIRSCRLVAREKLPGPPAPPAPVNPAAPGAKPAKKPWWKLF